MYNFNHETIIILENSCVKTLFFENTLVFSVQVLVLWAQINHGSFETFIKWVKIRQSCTFEIKAKIRTITLLCFVFCTSISLARLFFPDSSETVKNDELLVIFRILKHFYIILKKIYCLKICTFKIRLKFKNTTVFFCKLVRLIISYKAWIFETLKVWNFISQRTVLKSFQV